MRLLSCLVLTALSVSPAFADEAAPVAQPAQVMAPHAEVQPSVPGTAQKKKRMLACPACASNTDPSFAIRPADQQAATNPVPPPTARMTEVPGTSAASPPVNFSFSGAADGSRSNRYRGGVSVGTSF